MAVSGSTPEESMRMIGVAGVDSANEWPRSKVGETTNSEPICSEMNSLAADDITSGRKHRRSTSRSRPLEKNIRVRRAQLFITFDKSYFLLFQTPGSSDWNGLTASYMLALQLEGSIFKCSMRPWKLGSCVEALMISAHDFSLNHSWAGLGCKLSL